VTSVVRQASGFRRYLGAGLLAVLTAGCAPPIDLRQAVEVTDVSSGWFDAGIVDGKNKLVPSITFRLKKSAGVDLDSLSLNMVFKKDGEQAHWDDVFVQRVEFAGDQTPPVTVRSDTGYTGDPPQTRLEMLKHTQFRDMDVQVFAKKSSSQWTELHKTRITRQLLTQ
jgi:hypothetical protein